MELSLETKMLVGQAIQEINNREKKEKFERFKHLNTYAKKGQIVFTGSSLMEQFPINEFIQDFDLPYIIYNRGVGGATTEELLPELQHCVYDLVPRAVLLNIGTNDMNGSEYQLEKMIGVYEAIIQAIMKNVPDVKLILLAYYPVNPFVEGPEYLEYVFKFRTNQTITEANQEVKMLAEKYGLPFLNLNRGITDPDGNMKEEYTIEGIHMFANGYKAVLNELLPALKRELENELQ